MTEIQTYDIIIFGGGIAGLFVANRLRRAGYNLILIEKDKLGGVQTLASQGMIHGGQKYTLQGNVTAQATSIAAMPERWDACFAGGGEVDLSSVKFLSDTQVMFPARFTSWLFSLAATLTVFAAARAVNGKTLKLKRAAFPEVLQHGPVYEMQEKVLDVKSLVAALVKNLQGRIFKGAAQEISPTGKVRIGDMVLQAQAVIFAAGTGNEAALQMLKVSEQHTQRRPLRQIMVRPMPQALYGHGIVGRPKPRVTITSHPDGTGNYIWYLGGNIAEEGAGLPETEALQFAKKEMQDIFPAIDWNDKEWASWQGDRAEPFDASGQLPSGPVVQQRGKILLVWPVKLTFAPLLADNIYNWLQKNDIKPSPASLPPTLPAAEIGAYPWEGAAWHRL
jgi:glycine/D-amino acid oxidase-like deaminating enzyme